MSKLSEAFGGKSLVWKKFVAWFALAAAVSVLPLAAAAQSDKPLRLVVGFAAGGPTDALARLIAPELGARLGRPVVVDNRGGAAGVIGLEAVMNSLPDGDTLGILALPSVVNYALLNKPFDIDRITPISLLYDSYNLLLINPSFPGLADVRNMKDLAAAAKVTPLNYTTSAGVGSLAHLNMELISQAAGVKMTNIPYKGAAPALNDVLGGVLGVIFGDSASAAPHIQSGKLRPILLVYDERVPELPEVATAVEQGFSGINGVSWLMLIGPPKLPKEMANRFAAEVQAVLAKPEVAEKMRTLYRVRPKSLSPEASRALVTHDFARWKKVIVDNNIKPQ